MAIISSTGITGFLQSVEKLTTKTLNKFGVEVPQFRSTFTEGFNGSGFKMWKKDTGKYKLELDELLVRGAMTIYELICSKIRSVNGGLFISQASGKIKSIEEVNGFYKITLEEGATGFVAGDLIRMQTYTGRSLRSYHVEVMDVLNGVLNIPKSAFNGSSTPLVGDEIVQCGNTTDTSRQTVIYLHADGSTPPAIDIMLGVNSKDWTDKVAVSLGYHNGQFGLYCKNGSIFSVNDSGNYIYELNKDGSGQIGNGAIHWDKNGNLFIEALDSIALTADKVSIGSHALSEVMSVTDDNVFFGGYTRSSFENFPIRSGSTSYKVGSHLNVRAYRASDSDSAYDSVIYLPNDPEYIGARVLIISDATKTDDGLVYPTNQLPLLRIVTGRFFCKHNYMSNIDYVTADNPYEICSDSAADPTANILGRLNCFTGAHWFIGCDGDGQRGATELQLKNGYVELMGVPSLINLPVYPYKLNADGTSDTSRKDNIYTGANNIPSETVSGAWLNVDGEAKQVSFPLRSVNICQWAIVGGNGVLFDSLTTI